MSETFFKFSLFSKCSLPSAVFVPRGHKTAAVECRMGGGGRGTIVRNQLWTPHFVWELFILRSVLSRNWATSCWARCCLWWQLHTPSPATINIITMASSVSTTQLHSVASLFYIFCRVFTITESVEHVWPTRSDVWRSFAYSCL